VREAVAVGEKVTVGRGLAEAVAVGVREPVGVGERETVRDGLFERETVRDGLFERETVGDGLFEREAVRDGLFERLAVSGVGHWYVTQPVIASEFVDWDDRQEVTLTKDVGKPTLKTQPEKRK
jgi:hypothetical protein